MIHHLTLTALSKGNTSLRNKDYRNAITHYLQALEEHPELSNTINASIKYANTKITQQQGPSTKQRNTYKEVEIITFDPRFYLNENPDVKAAGINPEGHYFSNGENEGRKPNAHFDPIFYKKLNADVRKAGISPFRHFCEFGYREGRIGTSPISNDSRIASTSRKPILFIGHDGIQAGSEIVLLEVIKWFYLNTNRRIKVLLLAPGPVANQYAHYANTYVLPNYEVDNKEELEDFLDEEFEFTYFNTVVSGRFFILTQQLDIKPFENIITHIHEMEKVLDTFSTEMEQLLSKSKSWISASPTSTETLVKKYKIPLESITTVPAFINPVVQEDNNSDQLRQEARRALGFSSKAVVVAGCGTVYWRKGPDIFIETARHIIEQESIECEFIWLGDGPDREKLVQSLTEKEKQYIKFVGSRSDANKILALADIFFLSSREDPFPLVVLEAAQHEIPSICFKPATGITSFIEKDAGIALEKINAASAAAAILDLIANPDKRERLGVTAKKKLFSTYTAEKQNLKIYNAIRQHTDYKPSVSVIVPFYNHEKFSAERINSITKQAIKDIEIIALDDNSTDNTVASLDSFRNDPRLKIIINQENSGSPFRQWQKGVSLANSDIVWIAEGDDSCDGNFLSTLLPYFNDPLINIAAAKTEIIDEHGTLKKGALNDYLDNAFQGKFENCYIKDGFQEINEQLGAVCTLVNASGILIRKSSFGKTLHVAHTYKIAGDWLIYLDCLRNGKIAFSTKTRNYFRRHSASQVHKLEGTEAYFLERNKITNFVFENYPVTPRLVKKVFVAIDHEWARFKHKHGEEKELNSFYSKEKLLQKAFIIQEKYHAAFYVHGMMFSKGGIERLAAQLANYLVARGWKVTIFCRVSKSSTPAYPLYESINVIPIFDEQQLEISARKLRQLLAYSDIDVFVPMLSEWLFDPIIEAAQNTGIPIIASEHNDPWKIEELWWSHEKRTECFNKADRIHLLLHSYTNSLPESLSKKISVIPNGVSIPEASTTKREKLIVSVGRLEPQKRFDRLIEAASLIQNSLRHAQYRIEIYGDGNLKNELQNQINSLGIDDLVFLMGKTSNIEEIYKKASLFALPSEFEGLPITLLEALSFGLPSIAFRNCNGPNEVIRDGLDGRLVESVRHLAEALQTFLAEPSLEAYRKNTKQRAKKYSIDIFFSNWETLLITTVRGPAHQ